MIIALFQQQPKARRALIQDTSGKAIYLEACKYFDVIPASYFTRNISSAVVNLAHHGLGVRGVKALVVALLQNTKIVELDLQDNDIGDEGGRDVAMLFADNFYITRLNLACNGLGLLTAQAFGESLEGNGTLRILDLSQNDLTSKCIELLCHGVANNYSIVELNLNKNKISSDGGKFIGSMLNEQRSLGILDLSWNGLGPRGCKAVLKGLKENIMLKRLNLAWNAIGVDGCKAVSKALRYIGVKELDISHNRILCEGAKSLAKGLKTNSCLEVLRVGQNILESAGICVILNAILSNSESKISTLDFSGTDLGQDFFELEKEARQAGRVIKFLHETKLKDKAAKQLTDPREMLKKFLEEHGIHKLDLFEFIDRDTSLSISVDEFRNGLKAAKCGLADFQIDELMRLLDKDNDGEIDYSEFSEL